VWRGRGPYENVDNLVDVNGVRIPDSQFDRDNVWNARLVNPTSAAMSAALDDLIDRPSVSDYVPSVQSEVWSIPRKEVSGTEATEVVVGPDTQELNAAYDDYVSKLPLPPVKRVKESLEPSGYVPKPVIRNSIFESMERARMRGTPEVGVGIQREVGYVDPLDVPRVGQMSFDNELRAAVGRRRARMPEEVVFSRSVRPRTDPNAAVDVGVINALAAGVRNTQQQAINEAIRARLVAMQAQQQVNYLVGEARGNYRFAPRTGKYKGYSYPSYKPYVDWAQSRLVERHIGRKGKKVRGRKRK